MHTPRITTTRKMLLADVPTMRRITPSRAHLWSLTELSGDLPCGVARALARGWGEGRLVLGAGGLGLGHRIIDRQDRFLRPSGTGGRRRLGRGRTGRGLPHARHLAIRAGNTAVQRQGLPRHHGRRAPGPPPHPPLHHRTADLLQGPCSRRPGRRNSPGPAGIAYGARP